MNACPTRKPTETLSTDITEFPMRWARSVTRQEASDRTKNGIFSTASADRVLAFGKFESRRFSGQKSSSNKTNGRLTTIGLHSKPRANKSRAIRYGRRPGFLAYLV